LAFVVVYIINARVGVAWHSADQLGCGVTATHQMLQNTNTRLMILKKTNVRRGDKNIVSVEIEASRERWREGRMKVVAPPTQRERCITGGRASLQTTTTYARPTARMNRMPIVLNSSPWHHTDPRLVGEAGWRHWWRQRVT